MSPAYVHYVTIDSPQNTVSSLAFSPDARYLASASEDKCLRVFDSQKKILIIWTHTHTEDFSAVAWSDHTLIAGTFDGVVKLLHPVAVRQLSVELYPVMFRFILPAVVADTAERAAHVRAIRSYCFHSAEW